MEKDLFEYMKNRIGCTYISDLPNNSYKVWQELKKIQLSDYPESQKVDFSRYVFGNSFTILFLQ